MLSSLGARSNAFTRQHVVGPAAGGLNVPRMVTFL